MKNLCIALCLAACPGLTAQAQVTYSQLWDQTYGGTDRDWNARVVSDGSSLFIFGDAQSNGTGNQTQTLCIDSAVTSDIWMLKTDLNGNILWQRAFGGWEDERAPHPVLLNNAAGEMLFACQTLSDTGCSKAQHNRDTIPPFSSDYWVVKLDSTGMIIWEKTLGGEGIDQAAYAAPLTNGNILVCGESNSGVGGDKTVPNNSLGKDYWAVMLDGAGNILNDFVYGGDGSEYLVAMIPLPGGGFLLGGSTNSSASGDVTDTLKGPRDYWMIRLDATGAKVWDHSYGGSAADVCYDIARTSDGGFLMTGYTLSPMDGDVSEPPVGFRDYWIVKTDSAGVKQWDKRYGGDINSQSFGTWGREAPGGQFWIGGHTDSQTGGNVSEPSYGNSDYWVLRVDTAGMPLWDKRLGGSAADELGNLVVLPQDSSVVLCGHSDAGSSSVKTATNQGWWDYWVTRFHYATPVGISEAPAAQQATVLPNPGSGLFHVRTGRPLATGTRVEVYDPSGRVILQQRLFASQEIALDLSSFADGMYQVRILSPDAVYYARLIKQE